MLLAYLSLLPFVILEGIFIEPIRLWKRMAFDLKVLRLRDELASKKIAIGIAAATYGTKDKLEMN
jgi:hypothetical protein